MSTLQKKKKKTPNQKKQHLVSETVATDSGTHQGAKSSSVEIFALAGAWALKPKEEGGSESPSSDVYTATFSPVA